jgi:membrane protease YdiL (CAAX protease family)
VPATLTFLAIQAPAPLQRLTNFAKSVWPADRGFVALLLGSILLLMSQNLGSWSGWIQALLRAYAPDSRFVAVDASSLLNFTMFLVYFAGASAFYVCFCPGPNPSRRLARWVYLPLALGLAANLATVLYLAKLSLSVPWPDGEPLSRDFDGFFRILHAAGYGIWSALLGIVLVLYGDLRLRSGCAELPVHLAPEFSARPDSFPDSQVNRFIWMMIALPFVAAFTDLPFFFIVSWIHGALHHGASSLTASWPLLYASGQVWQAATLFALLYVAMGPARRESLKQSLRIPSMLYLGLGILLPTTVWAALPTLQYVFDRIHWAAYDFGHLGPPIFSSYFSQLPKWLYLFMLFSALVEEIAWRGYLQPRFISRYGLYRGIFLVGIVWAVFHYPLESYWRTSFSDVLIHSGGRLLDCIAMGFALSWLTLRSKSVLPAGLAHGFSNFLLMAGYRGVSSRWIVITVILMWIIIDAVLFRFLPPTVETDSDPQELTPVDPPQLLDTPTEFPQL